MCKSESSTQQIRFYLFFLHYFLLFLRLSSDSNLAYESACHGGDPSNADKLHANMLLFASVKKGRLLPELLAFRSDAPQIWPLRQ